MTFLVSYLRIWEISFLINYIAGLTNEIWEKEVIPEE